MKYDEIKTAWNAQAEDGNGWYSLSEYEKIEWAARLGAATERAARQKALCQFASSAIDATNSTRQGLEQLIEQVGDVHFQRCRVGSKEGAIRWDIEFGHYGAEVRGKTLRDAITKAIAAQAKQGEQ